MYLCLFSPLHQTMGFTFRIHSTCLSWYCPQYGESRVGGGQHEKCEKMAQILESVFDSEKCKGASEMATVRLNGIDLQHGVTSTMLT